MAESRFECYSMNESVVVGKLYSWWWWTILIGTFSPDDRPSGIGTEREREIASNYQLRYIFFTVSIYSRACTIIYSRLILSEIVNLERHKLEKGHKVHRTEH